MLKKKIKFEKLFDWFRFLSLVSTASSFILIRPSVDQPFQFLYLFFGWIFGSMIHKTLVFFLIHFVYSYISWIEVISFYHIGNLKSVKHSLAFVYVSVSYSNECICYDSSKTIHIHTELRSQVFRCNRECKFGELSHNLML